MPDNTPSGTDVAVIPQMSSELVKTFAAMAMMIPSETTDALDSIIGQILNSPSWEQLADPWETANVDKLKGRVLRVDQLTRRPSQFKDGLGVFLVVNATDTRSGEALVFTTSSMSVVAQLVKAHVAGWLPLYVELVVAERATEAGYKPHHLVVHGQAPRETAAANGDSAETPGF
jgi:hypothetical protein